MLHLLFPLIMSIISNQLEITSTAFKNNEIIPEKYTCEGNNINPPLSIKNIPSNTKSVVLIMDDPDASKNTFDHWIVWNIGNKGDEIKIEENSVNPGTQGKNGKGENGYTGPCPPQGVHHYHFKVYALDVILNNSMNDDKNAVEKAMQSHIIATGELIGLYQKKNK